MVEDENILEYMWLVARLASRRARAISDSSACNAAGDELVDTTLRAALPG